MIVTIIVKKLNLICHISDIFVAQKRWVQLIMLMQNAVVKLILIGFLVLSSVEAYIIYNKKNICQKGIWILIRCHISINKNVLSASLNKTFPAFLLNLAVWLIHHGGPIGLFLIPASAPRLVCAILSVGWYIHIIESVLLIGKNSPCSGSNRFPLLLSEQSFTKNVRQMSVKKNVLSVSLNKRLPSFLLNLVVWLIHHGGPIGLFLIPASAPRLVCAILSVGWYIYNRICAILSVGWYIYNRIGKNSPCSGSNRFPLLLSEQSFTKNVRQMSVKKMCWVRH